MVAMPLRLGEGGGVFRPEPPAQNAKRIVRVAQEVLHKLYPDEVLPRVAATPAQIFKELRKVVHLHKDDPQLAAQLVDALDKQEYVLAVLYLKGGVRLTRQQINSVLRPMRPTINSNFRFTRIPPPDTLVVLIKNDLFVETTSKIPNVMLGLLIMQLQKDGEERPVLYKALFDLPQVLEIFTQFWGDEGTPDQNKLRLAISLNLHEEVRLLLARGIKLPPSVQNRSTIKCLILSGRLEMLERVLQGGGICPDQTIRDEVEKCLAMILISMAHEMKLKEMNR